MDNERGLFIVSDGMGGQVAGEVASNAVVTVLPRLIVRRLAQTSVKSTAAAERMLSGAIVELSTRLRAETAGRAGLEGLGATVVLAWIRGERAHLAHMGDSRIYLFRNGSLTQLTEDHSVVAMLLKLGDITPEQAQRHPTRSQVSRYVGMEGEVYPDVQTLGLITGDRLLLCTDGLTNMVAGELIADILGTRCNAEAASQALVAAANAAGGEDNITALVVNWRC